MKLKSFVVLIFFTVAVAGCNLMSFQPLLEKGDEIPEGKVLVIGKLMIEPRAYKAGEHPDHVNKDTYVIVQMTNDLSKPFEEGAWNIPDDAIAPFPEEVFYALLPHGGRYIRNGMVRTPVRVWGDWQFETMNLMKTVKLDIPAKAKAVYIGTIHYKRNGKKLLSVSVHDDYEQTMREFRAMKIQGINQSDIVKRIAIVMK